MTLLPSEYSAKRSGLGFDQIRCGFGGIELDPVPVEAAGRIEIGSEIGCGDRLVLAAAPPHAVSAVIGDALSPVAPSLDAFWECLTALRAFAKDRGTPAAMEANPPSEAEIEDFLEKIDSATNGDEAAAYFWALVAEIAPFDDDDEDDG